RATSAAPQSRLLKLKIAEYAYQVAILAAYAHLYVGGETSTTVDETTQAAFYAKAIQSYLACDPSISVVLFFHLVDETDLGRFQSGLVRADRSRRPSFDAVTQAIQCGCTGAQSSWQPTHAFGTAGTGAALTARPAAATRSHSSLAARFVTRLESALRDQQAALTAIRHRRRGAALAGLTHAVGVLGGVRE